jgi:hypothetical protein
LERGKLYIGEVLQGNWQREVRLLEIKFWGKVNYMWSRNFEEEVPCALPGG